MRTYRNSVATSFEVMMPTAVVCPSCSAKLKIGDTITASKVKCPKCGNAIALRAAPPKTPSKRTEKAKPQASVPKEDVGFEVVDELPIEERPVKRRRRRPQPTDEAERGMPGWVVPAIGSAFAIATIVVLALVIAKGSFVA